MGSRRLTCPDRASARYLIIFAELGMSSISIPYDPTQTARFLPELERAFDRIKRLLQKRFPERQQYNTAARRNYKRLRDELQQGETQFPI